MASITITIAGETITLDELSYDKLERYAYDNLYDMMNSRFNIPDPRNRPRTSNFIYTYDPLDSVRVNIDESFFPHIVLGLPDRVEESQKSTDGSTKRYTWNHNIIVRAARYGAGGSKNGKNDLLDISSSMHKFFNIPSKRKNFGNVKMRNIKLTKVSTDLSSYDTTEFYESVFELTYSVRLNVVS